MRRSTSRIAAVYSSSLARSRPPRPARSRASLPGDGVEADAVPSSPHPARGGRPRRWSPLPPKRRSKTTRGVVLHRQRRRLAQPVQRVGVDATVAGVARAERLLGVERELQRRELRLLRELARREIWSIETPARMSAPAVFLGCTPVRNAPAARAWSPAPLARQRVAVLVGEPRSGTVSRSRNGSSGCMTGFIPKPLPRRVGRPLVHHDAVRHVDDAQPLDGGPRPRRGAATGAGTMPSRSGRASVAPTPRRNVRRGRWVFVMIIALAPFSSGTACSRRCRRRGKTSGSRPARRRRRCGESTGGRSTRRPRPSA